MTGTELTLPPAPGRRGWPWTGVDRQGTGTAPFRDPPRISIVTPSFNQIAFVEATLRSVLLQDYPNLEYIVMDGGSTDGAADVVRRYAPHLAAWEVAPDRGQAHAINKGFARATGDVLGWLNSDDRLLPGALWRVAAAARENPHAAAWVGEVRSVTPAGGLIYRQVPRGLLRDSLADWGHAGQVSQPGCFFSRSALERSGPLDESLHYVFDVDLWIRLAAEGAFVTIHQLLAEETIHAAAKTHAQRGRSLAELHLLQIRHGYTELAMRRMADELQEYDTLKRGTLVERARWQAGIALRSALSLFRRT